MILLPKKGRGRNNFNFDHSKFKLKKNFVFNFNKKLQPGRKRHLRKLGYRKLQVSSDPSNILQSKGFRGKKSNFVQNFFKCRLKDEANQRNFVRKTCVKN